MARPKRHSTVNALCSFVLHSPATSLPRRTLGRMPTLRPLPVSLPHRAAAAILAGLRAPHPGPRDPLTRPRLHLAGCRWESEDPPGRGSGGGSVLGSRQGSESGRVVRVEVGTRVRVWGRRPGSEAGPESARRCGGSWCSRETGARGGRARERAPPPGGGLVEAPRGPSTGGRSSRGKGAHLRSSPVPAAARRLQPPPDSAAFPCPQQPRTARARSPCGKQARAQHRPKAGAGGSSPCPFQWGAGGWGWTRLQSRCLETAPPAPSNFL